MLKLFDILPGVEFLRRRGPRAERPLDLTAVPSQLHALAPLVERWGETCDPTRHELASRASSRELAEISASLGPFREAIVDWLYSLDDAPEYSNEAARYRALLVFEMEECDGPGIPGALDYRLQKYKQHATPESLARLRKAHATISDVAKRIGDDFYAEELAEAAELLRDAERQ